MIEQHLFLPTPRLLRTSADTFSTAPLEIACSPAHPHDLSAQMAPIAIANLTRLNS
jgi:hypothetical protein